MDIDDFSNGNKRISTVESEWNSGNGWFYDLLNLIN